MHGPGVEAIVAIIAVASIYLGFTAVLQLVYT